jgi:hypothetical protein
MVNVEMRIAHRFDHQGVKDQPTACGRTGQACHSSFVGIWIQSLGLGLRRVRAQAVGYEDGNWK